MKTTFWILLFIIGILLVSNCTLSTWRNVADIYCNLYADCLKGEGAFELDAVGACKCICDDGWCGPRCELQMSFCEGNGGTVVYTENVWNYEFYCSCKCPPPFTNGPYCNTIEIPFSPNEEETSLNGNQHYNKVNTTADYFPLVKSNIWIFDVFDEFGDKDSEFGFRIRESFIYEDERYYDCQFLIPDTLTGLIGEKPAIIGPLLYNLPENPNQIAQRVNDTTTVLLFFHDYTDGDTVVINGDTAFVDLIGPVTVPSGSYDDCYSVLDTTGTGNIFAPGVGWIAFLTDFDTTAVLATVEIACSIGAEISMTNLTCSGANDGMINIDVTGDTTGLSFTWDGPTDIGDEQNPTNLSPGLYYLTVSNINCQAMVDSIPINAPSEIEIQLVNFTDSSCPDSSDGSIDIAVGGGTGPLSISWNNGQFTTEDIGNLSVGEYIVVVTDSLNCSNSLSVEIMDPEPILLNEILFHISCNGEIDGGITLNASGGTPGYTYNWSNGDSGEEIGNLTPGSYTVTVMDQNQCSVEHTFDISEPDVLDVSLLNSNDLDCFEAMNGSASISIAGGTAPIQISWSNGGDTEIINNLDGGTYGVTVTDANNCSDELSLDISEPGELILNNIVELDASCSGISDGAVSFSISGGTPPYQSNWNNGQSGINLSNLESGNYSVTVTDVNDCTITHDFIVGQAESILIQNTLLADVSCFGFNDGAIGIDISGGTAPYNTAWNDSSTGTSLVDLLAGYYSVTVTDANNCTEEYSLEITEPDELEVDISVDDMVSCYEANDGRISSTISGGTPPYNLMWNSSIDLNNLPSGDYSVTVTDANNCSATKSIKLTQPDELVTIALIVEKISCFGAQDGSLFVAVTGGTAPYYYSWATGDSTQAINNLTQGSYSLTVTDANNCTDELTVDLDQPAQLEINVLDEVDLSCKNSDDGSISIEVTGGAPPYVALWNTGQNGLNIDKLSAGDYSVTLTDSEDCMEETSFELFEPDELISNTIQIDNASCFDYEDGGAFLEIAGGTAPYTIVWDNSQSGELLVNVASGEYFATVSDANDCSTVHSVIIDEPDQLSIIEIEKLPVSCFGDSDGYVELEINGGTAPYMVNWDNGVVGTTLDNLSGGDYTIQVRDANGCEAIYMLTVIEPEQLSISETSNESVSCFGYSDGKVEIEISGGTVPYSINWSTGETNASIVDLPAGDYTVTVSDFKACTVEYSLIIDEPDSISITLLTNLSVKCYGAEDGELEVQVTGGTAPYIVNWDNGNTGTSNAGLVAGSYMADVTDANGCSTQFSAEVSQPDSLQLLLSSTNAQGSMANGQAEVMVSGGTPPYSYIWDDDNTQTNALAIDLIAGMYTVIISDANGCSIEGTIDVGMSTSILEDERIEITIYPNPTRNQIYVSREHFDGSIFKMEILSSQGFLIQPDIFTQNAYYQIDLSNLSSGVYLLKLNTSRGIYLKQVIKL